jgi:hypothetical protein
MSRKKDDFGRESLKKSDLSYKSMNSIIGAFTAFHNNIPNSGIAV